MYDELKILNYAQHLKELMGLSEWRIEQMQHQPRQSSDRELVFLVSKTDYSLALDASIPPSNPDDLREQVLEGLLEAFTLPFRHFFCALLTDMDPQVANVCGEMLNFEVMRNNRRLARAISHAFPLHEVQYNQALKEFRKAFLKEDPAEVLTESDLNPGDIIEFEVTEGSGIFQSAQVTGTDLDSGVISVKLLDVVQLGAEPSKGPEIYQNHHASSIYDTLSNEVEKLRQKNDKLQQENLLLTDRVKERDDKLKSVQAAHDGLWTQLAETNKQFALEMDDYKGSRNSMLRHIALLEQQIPGSDQSAGVLADRLVFDPETQLFSLYKGDLKLDLARSVFTDMIAAKVPSEVNLLPKGKVIVPHKRDKTLTQIPKEDQVLYDPMILNENSELKSQLETARNTLAQLQDMIDAVTPLKISTELFEFKDDRNAFADLQAIKFGNEYYLSVHDIQNWLPGLTIFKTQHTDGSESVKLRNERVLFSTGNALAFGFKFKDFYVIPDDLFGKLGTAPILLKNIGFEMNEWNLVFHPKKDPEYFSTDEFEATTGYKLDSVQLTLPGPVSIKQDFESQGTDYLLNPESGVLTLTEKGKTVRDAIEQGQLMIEKNQTQIEFFDKDWIKLPFEVPDGFTIQVRPVEYEVQTIPYALGIDYNYDQDQNSIQWLWRGAIKLGQTLVVERVKRPVKKLDKLL